jgi:hypothetical protein
MKRAKHINQTEREFRARKRREFKALEKAFDKFVYGCVYTPLSDGEVGRIGNELEAMRKVLQPWWRKA